MRILFDHNMPKRFRRRLIGHDVKTTREMRWEDLANGQLQFQRSIQRVADADAIRRAD